MYTFFWRRLDGELILSLVGTLPSLAQFLKASVIGPPVYSTLANSVSAKGYYVGDFLDTDKVPTVVIIVPNGE